MRHLPRHGSAKEPDLQDWQPKCKRCPGRKSYQLLPLLLMIVDRHETRLLRIRHVFTHATQNHSANHTWRTLQFRQLVKSDPRVIRVIATYTFCPARADGTAFVGEPQNKNQHLMAFRLGQNHLEAVESFGFDRWDGLGAAGKSAENQSGSDCQKKTRTLHCAPKIQPVRLNSDASKNKQNTQARKKLPSDDRTCLGAVVCSYSASGQTRHTPSAPRPGSGQKSSTQAGEYHEWGN
jgi:hypothetical protein